MKLDVTIPDIGDFSDVPIVEIPVAPGDLVSKDDPILMLESDKATLDIPSPTDGRIVAIGVAVGDRVSAGKVVMQLETAADAAVPSQAPAAETKGAAAGLVVIGAGPGGYTAAFRAADLGMEVTLIDPRETLGGVCLNVGCIPSKALLHLAKVRDEAEAAAQHGLGFGSVAVDLDKVRAFKDQTVAKLTRGLDGLARKRKVRVLRGEARFTGPSSLAVDGPSGTETLTFSKAIIATGSEPVTLPFLPDDPRIMDSTGALNLDDIPDRLLVIGGGIIGLEMAQVYHALGSAVDVVEMGDQIIPGADGDLVSPLARRLTERYAGLRTGTRVIAVTAAETLEATFEGPKGTSKGRYDRILVSIGRRPVAGRVQPEAAGITPDKAGFIPVDSAMRTAQPHIFAVGDVVGQPMLAHKAAHQGKVAAEVAAGEVAVFEPACIPSVAYTDPEVAWAGMTEAGARKSGARIKTASFPWMASGRALSMDRAEGLTKLVFDSETGKVVGGGIVGQSAGDLIAEIVLAIEMGADAEDIGLSIHPHPTLSETIGFAAEARAGTLTDL